MTSGNVLVRLVLFPDRSVHEAAVLVLAVVSDCRDAASVAAAAASHACCVGVFFIHNADSSSTDVDSHASGRSPQSGAYVATDVFTEPLTRA